MSLQLKEAESERDMAERHLKELRQEVLISTGATSLGGGILNILEPLNYIILWKNVA